MIKTVSGLMRRLTASSIQVHWLVLRYKSQAMVVISIGERRKRSTTDRKRSTLLLAAMDQDFAHTSRLRCNITTRIIISLRPSLPSILPYTIISRAGGGLVQKTLPLTVKAATAGLVILERWTLFAWPQARGCEDHYIKNTQDQPTALSL